MRYRWIGITLLAVTAAIVLVPPMISSRPNEPYPAEESHQKVLYQPFSYEPQEFDPAVSYSSGESLFLANVYEPPFQYHYLKRPYVLEPLTCREVPVGKYLDAAGNPLPPDANPEKVARVTYEIRLKEGIRYHPHPCFARTPDGKYAYHALKDPDIQSFRTPADFPLKDTRELAAADYVYEIKRLCVPNQQKPCPILATVSLYIDGMEEYATALQKDLSGIRAQREREQGLAYIQEIDEGKRPINLDLGKHPFPGVEVVDRYTFRIHLKKPYPQVLYWLAMTFFAPVPWEATAFYRQAPMISRNITLNRYPVGTGPFIPEVLECNRLISFVRNPDFRDERYPSEGTPEDRKAGLLAAAGQRLPMLDKIVYLRERESTPTWIKFLQGYYDTSGVGSTNFDQSVKFKGELEASAVGDELREKGIGLSSSKGLTIGYYAFNMLDPVFGGYSEKQQKLRRAIAIAMDTEELIQVFDNGMGVELQGILPEGILGYRGGPEGMNTNVFEWDASRGRPKRKSLDEARRLLAEAGYPGGVGPDGRPLVVNFDNAATGGGADAYFRWLHRQFGKLGITVINRTTDSSTFDSKALEGKVQMFRYGWLPDYPDPETYLFLLYGPNSIVKSHGPNPANYQNDEYDRLFNKMLTMPNSPERQQTIEQMQKILQRDLPWFSVKQNAAFTLTHGWVKNSKINVMAWNKDKYVDIDVEERERYRQAENQPLRWPIYAPVALVLVVALPALRRRIKREQG